MKTNLGLKKQKRKRLLLIAGYASTAVSLFPLFNELSYEYELTGIDVLGFGCSGRPDFTTDTIEKVLAYFDY